MERERSAAAVMLGMAGFVVLAVSEHEGELEQAIETTADLVGCPTCAAVAQCHDRRPVWVRDLPSAGRPVTVVWIKRVWRCRHQLCPRRTWTETSPAIAARASLTARARAEICRRVGEDGASVAAVAREFGIGWRTAMTAVREHGAPRVNAPDRLAGIDAVGVDETAFQAAAATRSTSFITGIVDLTRGRGPARLLDVVEGRSASALLSWVNDQDRAWRDRITTAALDPYRGYASALRTALPDAVRVLDAFHVVRLGFAAVDDVRRRIQQAQTGHRGRTGDPLYGIRRLLRRRHDHHSDKSWARLLAGLDAGDTADEQLARTWVAAQDLRLIYQAGDRARAAEALYQWLTYCADADIPELTRLARTIDSWRPEFLAYFDTGGISNGPTEAVNLLIKKIKRVGHGFRNFDNYRLRLLLHCGVDWDTIRATPIRGRLPRSVA
ncbi:MAG: ISL3 family transposase [Tomitella sp.]|nr:ISL3 family transposase [Tomitella sp.]